LNATGLGFNFPIALDALLISNDEWLLIESKHQFTTKYLTLFKKKCDFIQQYSSESWVRKEYNKPTKIHIAVNSIGDYEKVRIDAESSSIHLLRNSLEYGEYN
jgi:hypothetical protein